MKILYDTEKLSRLLQDIYTLTGVGISILDTEYRPIITFSAPGNYCTLLQSLPGERKRCSTCDHIILERCKKSMKMERQICRAGLYDAAMPILKNGEPVAYALMGQVRSENSPKKASYLPPTDQEKLNRLYDQLPLVSPERLESLYHLLPYILFESAMRFLPDTPIQEAADYIRVHLQESLSIGSLCQRFHLSKNALYAGFRRELNQTVGEYIAACRLEKAKQLLTVTTTPVYLVAAAVGIENTPYFCRWFKEQSGYSPTEYRKNKQGNTKK